MQRLHRWVRGRLWWAAFLIAAAVIIGLFAGSRDHMTKFDGLEANFENVEDHLRSLLDQASH